MQGSAIFFFFFGTLPNDKMTQENIREKRKGKKE